MRGLPGLSKSTFAGGILGGRSWEICHLSWDVRLLLDKRVHVKYRLRSLIWSSIRVVEVDKHACGLEVEANERESARRIG